MRIEEVLWIEPIVAPASRWSKGALPKCCQAFEMIPPDEQRTRSRWFSNAGLFLLMLSLVSAASLLTIPDDRAPMYRPKPGELRLYSGTLQTSWDGSRSRSRNIYFRIKGASPTFSYTTDTTTLTLAHRCLLPGSPVTVGVVPSSLAVWQLTCGGTTITDIDSTAMRDLKDRRRGRNNMIFVAIACGIMGLCRIAFDFLTRCPEDGDGGL
jgi:hypothetical protein